MKAILEYTEDLSSTIKTFWFRPEKLLTHVAGQFTELYLPHKNADERGEKHWFTISASPTEELLAITTKFAVKSSSFKKQLLKLQPGDEVTLAEPMGDFILPKSKDLPLVFIAGGIGITPFRSIIKWLVDTKEKRDITLYYAAQTEDNLVFKELFDSAGIKANYILSNPEQDWTGLTGRLSADKVLSGLNTISNQYFYMSGPEPMIEALEQDFITAGVPKNQIATDFFPGYPST